jgi:hypothetical protein
LELFLDGSDVTVIRRERQSAEENCEGETSL